MKSIHLPFCYYPDPVGGTEVYVASLARHLQELGHETIVAAPGVTNQTYQHEHVRVRRFALTPSSGDVGEIYGAGDAPAAAAFGAILDDEQPDVVHMHALTAGVSLRVLRQVKQRNIPAVFTYHTPTVSCVRGTLMRWGSEFCDGQVKRHLCSRCTLHGLGLSRSVASLVGSLPVTTGRWVGRHHFSGRVWTALRMTELVDQRHTVFQAMLAEADHLVAVCEWGRAVLLRNGIAPERVSLCRHGLPHSSPVTAPVLRTSNGELRVVFMGRFHLTKGVHVLIKAFQLAPKLNARLDVFGIAQEDAGQKYQAQMEKLARTDPRIAFHAPVASQQVVDTLRNYDVLAVPSQWLETGPLVALEAFAAGIPVIGWNVGGTAELIRHEVNGLLVEPTAVAGWTAALKRLVNDRALLHRLGDGVRPPRKSVEVAREMAELYQRLCDSYASPHSLHSVH